MDRGLPHRRRQARAIAISESIADRNRALVNKVATVLAATAVAVQAIVVVHGYLVGSHP